jgi:hypothetical protein
LLRETFDHGFFQNQIEELTRPVIEKDEIVRGFFYPFRRTGDPSISE